MTEYRIRFSKVGRAIYISHLDLMRTMQRAFIRADLKIKHTEGFNPHPYMNFALPLSVGTESICELMDFRLVDDVSAEKIPEMLNRVLPDGINVTEAYEPRKKFSDIVWLKISGTWRYNGYIENIFKKTVDFFENESIIIEKKSKRGIVEFDVAQHLKRIDFKIAGEHEIELAAISEAQNPGLNPELLISAMMQKAPELLPEFSRFRRLETLNSNLEMFR